MEGDLFARLSLAELYYLYDEVGERQDIHSQKVRKKVLEELSRRKYDNNGGKRGSRN